MVEDRLHRRVWTRQPDNCQKLPNQLGQLSLVKLMVLDSDLARPTEAVLIGLEAFPSVSHLGLDADGSITEPFVLSRRSGHPHELAHTLANLQVDITDKDDG